MPEKMRFLYLLFPALILGACSNGTPAEKASSDEIIPVEAMTIKPGSMPHVINAVGTVRYRRETPLAFTTSGKVASVRYEEGDRVRAGQLLAALDVTLVDADLRSAEAERSRARAEFERIKALFNDGWITRQRFEAAEAAAKAADAKMSQARFANETSKLFAPSNGVILTRNVQPGQVIAAGSVALILGENDDGFIFRAPIIDKDASKLQVGMPASIMIDSLGDEPISASISEIDGRANEATGAFIVQFRLTPRPQMRSGQIGSASITLPANGDGTLQIPASALFAVRTGEGLVYVIDPKSNKVETRNVAIEKLTDGSVIISGGVKYGDVIVTSGAEKLHVGARVRIVQHTK